MIRPFRFTAESGNEMFAARLSCHSYAFDPIGVAPDVLGPDHIAAYDRSAIRVIDAWRAIAPDTPVQMSSGEVPAGMLWRYIFGDNLMHGWDLARATGQDFEPPAHVVEVAYDRFYGTLPDTARGEGHGFNDAVTIADSAPKLDRLLAYTGRQP